ncbi:MAG: ABC transporter ATP-binding protein [Lachnospiraceae bacterium]
MALLTIQNLEIKYGSTCAVQDLSLKLQDGEVLGIAGESGSGKSTLLKAILGILENGQVTHGSIRFGDRKLLQLSREAMRQIRGSEIGMVFQYAEDSFCPVRTIGAQLYEGVRQHEKVSKQEAYDRGTALLEAMHIQEPNRILKSYPFELSGGMNQRVGLMMAMVMKPKLLLVDEPTSALDVLVQAQVVEELLKMRDLFGTSIVIVSHNMGLLGRMADTIGVMQKGSLIELDTSRNILYQPKEAYTKQLLAALPRLTRQPGS